MTLCNLNFGTIEVDVLDNSTLHAISLYACGIGVRIHMYRSRKREYSEYSTCSNMEHDYVLIGCMSGDVV